MKIDGNGLNPNVASLGTGSTDRTRLDQGGKGQEAGGTASADTVQLSSDAQFAERLRQVVNATPDIRQDKVDEARRMLAAGEIGNDPAALAASLIDHMLEG